MKRKRYDVHHPVSEDNRKLDGGSVFNKPPEQPKRRQVRKSKRKQYGATFPRASAVTITRADGTVERQKALTPRELQAVVKVRNVTPAMRHRVLKRDRGLCRYCGCDVSISGAEIDHVTPIAKGGTNSLSNLVTACRDCNGRKGVQVWKPKPIGYCAEVLGQPAAAERLTSS